MVATLTAGMELADEVRVLPGGLLDRGLTLPASWQTTGGIAVPWYGCGQPIVRDKCISSEDEPTRDTIAEYYPFPIEQGSSCSTIGGENLEAHARYRLDSTTEWAVAQQLQFDVAGTGSPKLADASDLGDYTDIVQAVAMLEHNAVGSGYGTPWFIHAPTYAAAYLRRFNLIGPNGETPGGGTWIISPGYSMNAPFPTIRLYVTGPVFVGVDTPEVRSAVGHRLNEIEAWALRWGLVAFDPCINLSVDITPCSNCLTAP